MALSRRHLILLSFGLLWFAARALAQTPAPAPAQAGTFRLVSLGSTERFLYDESPRSTRTVSPGVSAFTRPQPIPADGKLRFYRIGQSADPKLPPPRLPIAELAVDTTAPRTLLVVLVPGGLPDLPPPKLSNGQPAEFSALVLDDSPASAPLNHLRVVSFSRRPAAVALGSQMVQIAPMKSALIPYPDGKRVPFKVATLTGDSWFPLVSNSQMLTPGTRLTLFLSDRDPSPEPKSFELVLRKIVEIP